jgi:hypothetical protein
MSFWSKKKVFFLVHIVSERGIEMDPAKVATLQAISTYPETFLGMVQWYMGLLLKWSM